MRYGVLCAAVLVMVCLAGPASAETKLFFVHNDHLGTPVAITDGDQDVVWRAQKTPFGVTSTRGIIGEDARFPGQVFDEETELSYNYFRDYDPSIGRYIQSDPIGILRNYSDPQLQLAISMGVPLKNAGERLRLNHVHNYTNQNPLSFVDLFGLVAEEYCKKVGYQACKKIAKECQLTCGIRGGGTMCTYPCQLAQSECRNKVDFTCRPEEDQGRTQCDDEVPEPDPLTPNCTFERWQAGLCSG